MRFLLRLLLVLGLGSYFWTITASRPNTRSDRSPGYSRQPWRHDLPARLCGDRQAAIRMHECDEAPIDARLNYHGRQELGSVCQQQSRSIRLMKTKPQD